MHTDSISVQRGIPSVGNDGKKEIKSNNAIDVFKEIPDNESTFTNIHNKDVCNVVLNISYDSNSYAPLRGNVRLTQNHLNENIQIDLSIW